MSGDRVRPRIAIYFDPDEDEPYYETALVIELESNCCLNVHGDGSIFFDDYLPTSAHGWERI